MLNQCPHQLDLWQWLFGMPSKIYAKVYFGKYFNIEVEDDVTAMAKYPNGATGVFITTTGDPCGSNRFEVQMDKGKLVAEDDTLTLWELDMAEPEFTKVNQKPFANEDRTADRR